MINFTLWLLPLHVRVDAVGQLAKLAANNPTFLRTKKHLHWFLKWAGEDKQLRAAVKAAHREWRIANPRKTVQG